MKENIVRTDLKLVQVFLPNTSTSGPGIYEVSVGDPNEFYCTCPGFSSRMKCKHITFVKARIDINNGNYPLEISSRATPDDAERAKESNEEFRDFIIKFGKVEVL
jgi:hypothetical protein